MNRETSRYVRLGIPEYEWLKALDGRHHIRELPVLWAKDSSFVEELLQRLVATKLILLSDCPIASEHLLREISAPGREDTVSWTQFGQLRIRIARLTQLFNWFGSLSPVRDRRLFALTMPAALIGVVLPLEILQVSGPLQGLTAGPWHLYDFVIVVDFLFAITFIHELGHALACALMGVPTREVGVMLYYFQPAAYVDITDSWRLSNKWHKVFIASAGIYFQFVAMGLVAIAWMLLRINHHYSKMIVLFFIMNISIIFSNLIPLLKLDGYWILSALVKVPNLRDRAVEWVWLVTRSTLTRRVIDPKSMKYNAVLTMPSLDRRLLAYYGLTTLTFGAASWIAGFGFLFGVARSIGIRDSYSSLCAVCVMVATGIVYAARSVRTQQQAAIVSPPTHKPEPGCIQPLSTGIDPALTLRLNPYITVMEGDNGSAIFGWSTPDQFEIVGLPRVFDLVAKLRVGTYRVEDLLPEHDSHSRVREFVNDLWHRKHVRYSSEWRALDDQDRYARQLGWLSQNKNVRGNEKAVMASLKGKTVTILGIGGLGTHVAWNLAACGIGGLNLVDGDIVALSNLNRQLLYLPSDVGQKKVAVAAEKLLQFNPGLRIRTRATTLQSVADVKEAIAGSDFVVRSLDTPLQIPRIVNEACVQAKVPCIGAGFLAQGSIIGPLVLPGKTACLECGVGATMPNIDRGIGTTLAPIVTLAAGIVATEIVSHLCALGDLRTAGSVLFIDAPTLNFSFQHVSRNLMCRVCGA